MLLSRGENPKIPIKFLPDLNKKVWGLHTKNLTIIAARTSNCKSAFALQLGWDIAKQEIPVLFLSLEMYEDSLIERLFCLSQKIDNYELLTGKFKKYENEWLQFEKELEGIPFVITDMLGKSWKDVSEYLEGLTTKPKVVIIDHLQEARDASLKSQKEIIDEYLKKLRLLSIKHDFSLVVCCQINRESQSDKVGAEPQMHHLKGSGYIEEGADYIFLLHWGWHYNKKLNKNNFIINIAKSRNGRPGWVNVKYKPENYFFYEEASEVEGQIGQLEKLKTKEREGNLNE